MVCFSKRHLQTFLQVTFCTKTWPSVYFCHFISFQLIKNLLSYHRKPKYLCVPPLKWGCVWLLKLLLIKYFMVSFRADFKAIVLVVKPSPHTDAVHTFTAGAVTHWITGVLKKKNLSITALHRLFPHLSLCFRLYTHHPLQTPSPIPSLSGSSLVSLLSAELPKTSLCRGAAALTLVPVAWASFTVSVDWQRECPGLMFPPVPTTFSRINHG